MTIRHHLATILARAGGLRGPQARKARLQPPATPTHTPYVRRYERVRHKLDMPSVGPMTAHYRADYGPMVSQSALLIRLGKGKGDAERLFE